MTRRKQRRKKMTVGFFPSYFHQPSPLRNRSVPPQRRVCFAAFKQIKNTFKVAFNSLLSKEPSGNPCGEPLQVFVYSNLFSFTIFQKSFYVSEAESSLMLVSPLARLISHQPLEITTWKTNTFPKLGTCRTSCWMVKIIPS